MIVERIKGPAGGHVMTLMAGTQEKTVNSPQDITV